MAGLSIDEVWDDTRRFFTRERALLLPLGFATFGLAALAGGMVIPTPKAPGEPLNPGPWMLALLPMLLLVTLGYLAISRMVLRSRISVAEALRDALRLMPRAIGLFVAIGFAFVLLSIAAALIAMLLAAVTGSGAQGMVTLGMAVMLPPIVVVSIRLVLIWPVLADREGPLRETFVEAVALTRGNALKIAGLLIAYFILYVLIVAVIESAVGSVLIILARATGVPALAPMLISVAVAAFNAVYMTLWSVFVARLYARLSGSMSGI